MRNWQEIHEWITGLGKPEGFDQYRKAKLNNQINTTAQLFVLTGSKNPSIRFDFFEIWPKSISSIQFDISAADIAYATADVEFQYNYYEMIRLNPSQK